MTKMVMTKNEYLKAQRAWRKAAGIRKGDKVKIIAEPPFGADPWGYPWNVNFNRFLRVGITLTVEVARASAEYGMFRYSLIDATCNRLTSYWLPYWIFVKVEDETEP